ncbi:MAG: AAA family ATPase [Deltaproteobacteria bacterium]|nr:AAA family ATPase [Deltaproteobacteria bacterium]
MYSLLEVQNFRGIERLTLDGLNRVNLVVGRNNCGKTSLLEAAALAWDPTVADSVLPSLFRQSAGSTEERYYRWLVRQSSPSASLEIRNGAHACSVVLNRVATEQPAGWTVRALPGGLQLLAKDRGGSVQVTTAQPQGPNQVVSKYAKAVRRKGGEEQIERLLRAVDSRVRKVRVDPAADGNHLMVDMGLAEMLPLTQVGDGMYRLVSMLSDLVGETPAFCLIDEIENGLHHSVLPAVWTALGEAAAQLDLQIIATTHSRECLEAADSAFEARSSYDLSVIQMFRLEGNVQGRLLGRDQVRAAAAGDVDLRS